MPSFKETVNDDLIAISQFEVIDDQSIAKEKKDKATALGIPIDVLTKSSSNIVTVPIPKGNGIEKFEPGRLGKDKTIRYSDIKRGVADPDIQKNSRFQISDLARKSLSIEAEETARIEREVQALVKIRVQEMSEQVKKDAFEQGFAAGKQEGHVEVVMQSTPIIERFDALVKSFETMKEELFRANEEFIIRVIYRLANMIVLKELQEDKDYTRRLVLGLFDRVGTRENVKVFVSSEEFSAAEQLKAGLAQTIGDLKNITVEVDSTINKGCRIETDFGEVDARLDVQIQNIALALGVNAAPASQKSEESEKKGS